LLDTILAAYGRGATFYQAAETRTADGGFLLEKNPSVREVLFVKKYGFKLDFVEPR